MKLNLTQLAIGFAAGYLLKDRIAAMVTKAPQATGALQLGAIDMNGLAMQQNPRHMGALQMGAIDMSGFGAVGMQQNPLHMGAIDMSGLSMY